MYQPEDFDKEKIEIVEYDSSWPEKFLSEKSNLEKFLAEFPGLVIEHFGSTSVPGLAAKPVIDIMIAIESKAFWSNTQKPLERLLYYFRFKNEEEMFFVKVPLHSPKRTHHLHIYEFQGARWKRELAFRDYLRNHPEEVKRYEALKREKTEKFAFDRTAYTESKAGYIQEVLMKIYAG